MEELYALIHSLNKHEKKFVRRFTMLSRNGADNVLPNFYDIIEKGDVFNEQKIKDNFKKKFPTTNIFVYKKRLYELTLNALKATNSPGTHELELLNRYMDVRILLAKGLYKRAKQDLDELVREADAIENFNLGLLFIGVKQNLLRARIYTKEDGYTTSDLKKREDLLINNVKIQSDLKHLFLRQIDVLYNRHPHNMGLDNEEMVNIMASPLLRLAPDSVQSKELYYAIHLRNFIYHNAIEKAFPLVERIIDIYEKALFPIEYERKITAYYYHVVCSVYLNKPKKSLHSLEQLFELKSSGKAQEVLLFALRNIAGVYYYYMGKQKNKAYELIDKTKQDYLKLDAFIPFESRIIIIQMAAAINISKNNFKEAIWWLNHLVYEKRYEERLDLQCWCKFMYMLCHFELKNYDLLESLYKSFYRLMHKLNYLGPVEQLMFNLFKDVINYSNNPKKSIDYERYKKTFLKLKTSINVEYHLSVKIFADYLEKKE